MEISCQVHAPTTLHTEKLFTVCIGQEVKWIVESVWLLRRKKSIAPTAIEPQFLGHPFFSLVTKATELAQILCTICDKIIFTSLLRKLVYPRKHSTSFSQKLQWKRISKMVSAGTLYLQF
jgi:hypothetical protein